MRSSGALVRLVLAGLVALLLLGAGCRKESRTLRIGYMICNSLEETRERFEPLTAYLSQATGARCEYQQTEIIINHLALVDRGRAGLRIWYLQTG